MAGSVDETALARDAAAKAAGVVQQASGGLLSGVKSFFIDTPVAAAKGVIGGVLRNTLWYAAGIGLMVFTGFGKHIAEAVGRKDWFDKFANLDPKTGGGMPQLLLKIVGAGAAVAGTTGAAQAGYNELTGQGGETDAGAGSGIGTALALAAGAAVVIGAVVNAGDGKPGTPGPTPATGKNAGAERSA